MGSMNSYVSVYARKLMFAQLAVCGVVAGAYLIFVDLDSMFAAVYGSGIAILIGFMLQLDVLRAERQAERNAAKSMAVLYVGAAQRFIMTVVAFALGMVLLKLQPLALCVGFALAQFCYVVLVRYQHAETQTDQRV